MVCGTDEDLVARMVRFHFEKELPKRQERLVTAWISGAQTWLNVNVCFADFLSNVGLTFDIEKPRVYVLQSQRYCWREKIQLTVDNFGDFKNRTALFPATRISKLFVCSDTSPTRSPIGKLGSKEGTYEQVDDPVWTTAQKRKRSRKLSSYNSEKN